MVLSNHQSHLDPILLGISLRRRTNFLARETLFRFWPLRLLIQSLDTIPIDREGSGLAGLKEMLRRLKAGEIVLVFPEGTRTPDGRLGPIKPGFCAVARRAGVPLLPVAIEGAFAAWPRWRWFPRPAVIHVSLGEPLDPATIRSMDDDQLIREVERRILLCQHEAHSSRRRALGDEALPRDGKSRQVAPPQELRPIVARP